MKSLCPYSGLTVSDWISVTASNFQIFSVQLMFDLGDVIINEKEEGNSKKKKESKFNVDHDLSSSYLIESIFLKQGFRKVDSDRWEFANEGFLRGQKHLLKTITRRKSAHAHGHGQQHSNGQNPSVSSCVEVGKFGLEEEVERLKRDKNVLMQELVRLRQQQQSTDNNLQTMVQRLQGMENRQQQLMSFLAKAVQSPHFSISVLTAAKPAKRDKDSASPDGQIVKYQPPMHEQAKAMLKQLMKMEPHKTGDDGFLLGDGTTTTEEMAISSNNVSGITLQEMPTASDIQSSSLTGATPENVTVAESPTPEEAIPSPDDLSLAEFASILPEKSTEMPSGNFMEPNIEDFSSFLDSDLFIDGDLPFDIDDIPRDPDLEPSVDKYASLLEDILMSSPLPGDMNVTPVDLRHKDNETQQK
ncbi:hypothetical protein Bca52824_075088 [Brassica carinata]|uniref:HSF-type DNA-binding domain-containing protein n=1 Tax=Brassica carinata TaxID=52824 RepID=A0A8X7TW23_BRACI|nr:hypothetical protein Bca52824_075088 [Brassica carinata]